MKLRICLAMGTMIGLATFASHVGAQSNDPAAPRSVNEAIGPFGFQQFPAWAMEAVPPGAIPGARHVGGDELIIAVSADGRQLFGFSERIPKWVQPAEEAPGDPAIVLIAGDHVAAAWSGRVCFAYSGTLGRWDVLRLEEDAKPLINKEVVTFRTPKEDYVFKAEWGRWFSAADIREGRVAKFLEERGDETNTEELQIIKLEHASADEVVRIVQQVYADRQLAIAADPQDNRVILRGPNSLLQNVTALARELDQISERKTTALPEALPPLSLLRKTYTEADAEAQALAVRVRVAESKQDLAAPGDGRPRLPMQKLRRELRTKVGEVFQRRQQLLEAELADLAERMEKMRRDLAVQQRLADQVIDRRVEELLMTAPRTSAATVAESIDRPSDNTGEGGSIAANEPTANTKVSESTKAEWEAATVVVNEIVTTEHGQEGSSARSCGAVISANGLVLTQLPTSGAASPEKDRKFNVRFDDGSQVAMTLHHDLGSRLVLLKPVDAIRVQNFLPLAESDVAEGERFMLVSFDTFSNAYLSYSVQVTFAKRLVANLGFPLFQLEIEQGGAIGGEPILTSSGELAGLVVMSDSPPSRGRIFAVSSSVVRDELQKAGVEIIKMPPSEP